MPPPPPPARAKGAQCCTVVEKTYKDRAAACGLRFKGIVATDKHFRGNLSIFPFYDEIKFGNAVQRGCTFAL